MDLGNGCEILGTAEHGQALLLKGSCPDILTFCLTYVTSKNFGLEHKPNDKLQRYALECIRPQFISNPLEHGKSWKLSKTSQGLCARYAPGQFFKEHHDGRFRWEQSICS